MKKLFQFAPIYIVIFLIIGILIGYYFTINKSIIITALVIEFLLLVGVYFKAKTTQFYSIFFSLLIYLISFTLGMATIFFKNELNSPLHYNHQIKQSSNNDIYQIKAKIIKQQKSSHQFQKFIVKIVAINGVKTKGNVLLNIKNDTLKKEFKIDDILLFYTVFKEIDASKNPYYFDYRNYLKKQQIHHQLLISINELKVLGSKTSIVGLADKLIKTINYKLKPYSIAQDELAVINAFLLGYRQDISKDLMESYINAGAIHIMAISGMHFGILFMILSALFKPLERFKNGKLWKMILIILLLWMYGFIAGLSGSVVRAVLMFSIVSIALNINKTTSILQILITSLLILLLINPYYLFDVGFQLSYAAVFSIVIFQPIFQKYWNPKNWFLKFYWDIFTVSLAAQIGVLPISLFYFHQFPGLFMVTNFVIIPFMGIILIGGLLVFILALLNALPLFLLKIYTTLIFLMNEVVKWVAAQESFLFKEIPFNLFMLISLFTVIISIIIYLKNHKLGYLKIVLITVIGFQLVLFHTKWKAEKSHELIVFHKNKQSIIGEKIGKNLTLFTDLDSLTIHKEHFLTAYYIGNSIKNTMVKRPKNVFFYNNQLIYIIDKSAIYKVKNLKPAIVILQNSPKINLSRLIQELNPKLIIADGSNYNMYVNLWSKTCLQTKTPFHQTRQKGAFIIKEDSIITLKK